MLSSRRARLLGSHLLGALLLSCCGPGGGGPPYGDTSHGGAGHGANGSSSGSGGPAGSGASGGAGAAGGGGVGEIPAEVCRFGDDLAFTLPSGFGPDQLDDLADDSGGTCVAGELSFATLDMDGDLRPDLVIADRCDPDVVGTTHWLVHLNEGDRFAPAAITWALPSGFAIDQLDDLADDSGGTCAVGELSFATVDMNGDLRPDLVVADRCDTDAVGTTHWLVYLNQENRFAESAIAWTLPSGFAIDQLDDLADDSGGTCAVGELSFATVDMNGDLRPDLVIADGCDTDGVGATHWLVYLNEGVRFAAAAIDWTLPADFMTEQIDDLARDSGGICSVGELSFATVDMDGDRRPDLVIADRCDADGVGTTHWQVYLNEGDRFAASPVDWPLPTGFAIDQLDDLEDDSGGSCLVGELSFTLGDADGDLLPDLLIADDCDHEHVGTTHWVVYLNTGSGFDSAAAWRLPGPAAGFGLDALDDRRGDDGGLCAQGELSFAAIDIDGDRVLDLVVSDDCDFEEVGTTHWRVFGGSCG